MKCPPTSTEDREALHKIKDRNAMSKLEGSNSFIKMFQKLINQLNYIMI
jgi:hypothetical protein